MKKVVIAQQRGKGGHSGASWKKETWRSSVGKVDIVEHHGKSSHSAAAWKRWT